MAKRITTARLLAGASGYSFKEWKGDFYPADLKADGMLAYYAARLPTVELNATFYRLPQDSVVANWARTVPTNFRFAVKASRRITHITRLKAESVAEPLALFYRVIGGLGDRRGPVLFQLPPNMKLDLARLEAFLALLPKDHRAAFEFRHESWFDDNVYAALRKAGAALCVSEREDNAPPPLVETAPFGYVRLRLETYSKRELARWAERLMATKWKTIHAYFMHEPTAPAYAAQLLALAAK